MQTFRLLKIARIVKALRVIRVFKLARHSVGLKALGKTMSANVKELGLLLLLLFIGAIMFASLAFVFEKDDPNTNFKTILTIQAVFNQLLVCGISELIIGLSEAESLYSVN